jgi:hypothetical protein
MRRFPTLLALLHARGAAAWQLAPSHASRRHAAPRMDVSLDQRTLSPATSWRLQLELGKPESAEKVSVTATIRFREEEGYEPPQGFLRIDSCLPGDVLALGEAPGRWQLSEDPEDRKVSVGMGGPAWAQHSVPSLPVASVLASRPGYAERAMSGEFVASTLRGRSSRIRPWQIC